MLRSQHGTNYVLDEQVYFSQYGPYAKTIQESTMIQLSCKFWESAWNLGWIIALANSSDTNLIMSLMSMKIVTNMTHMQYHPR